MNKYTTIGVMTLLLIISNSTTLAQQTTPSRVASGCVNVQGQIPRNQCLFANSLLSLYGGAACQTNRSDQQQFDSCYRNAIDYLRNHYAQNNGWEGIYTQYSVASDPFTAISYMECHYEGNVAWDNKQAMSRCSAKTLDEYANDYQRDKTLSLHFAPPKRGIKRAQTTTPQKKIVEEKAAPVCPSIHKGWTRHASIDCSVRATGPDPCEPSRGVLVGGGSIIMPSEAGEEPTKDPNANNYCACGRIDRTNTLSCMWVSPG